MKDLKLQINGRRTISCHCNQRKIMTLMYSDILRRILGKVCILEYITLAYNFKSCYFLKYLFYTINSHSYLSNSLTSRRDPRSTNLTKNCPLFSFRLVPPGLVKNPTINVRASARKGAGTCGWGMEVCDLSIGPAVSCWIE